MPSGSPECRVLIGRDPRNTGNCFSLRRQCPAVPTPEPFEHGRPWPSRWLSRAQLRMKKVRMESIAMDRRRKLCCIVPSLSCTLSINPAPCCSPDCTLTFASSPRVSQHPPAPCRVNKRPGEALWRGDQGAPQHAECMGLDLLFLLLR